MTHPPPPASFDVLGISIQRKSYASALKRCQLLAKENRPAAVAACNTHLVTAARRDPAFRAVLNSFDLRLPDGMPLVWAMNARGADLKERVYGPYFMRHVIEQTPRPWKHFFFGGSESCLANLRTQLLQMQPDLDIAGMLSPPYRKWTEEDQAAFAEQINAADPDFIWVALGGVRQECWIAENRRRFRRGVFLGVGDAFELLAGRRKFAPLWMQKAGLTWLHRLSQEPRRLWLRYARHNSLFVWYLMRDTVFPQPSGGRDAPGAGSGLRVAFLGSRGTPARYAGFETVVEELGARLVEAGCEVTVYNRTLHYPERPRSHRGMRIIYVPSIPARGLETFVHTMLSTFHAIWRRYDLIYLCGVGNAILAGLLKLRGTKVLINVDGVDFRRAKWSGFAKWWLRKSEQWAVALGNCVIADNRSVVEHYRKTYDFKPVYLSYGTYCDLPPANAGMLQQHGLKPREYILFVGRLSAENEADTLIAAYCQTKLALPLVIVGSPGYETKYYEALKKQADGRVIFTGGVYGDGYRELSQNCRFFVLPAAIEATRLVLLDQMGMGNAILFKESAATREVICEAGLSFSEMPGESLPERLVELAKDPERCERLGKEARERARERFSWEAVTEIYLEIFRTLLSGQRFEERVHPVSAERAEAVQSVPR